MIKTEDSKRSDDWVVSVVGNFVEKRIFRYYSGLTRNWKFGQIWHFQFGQLPICYFPCQISRYRTTRFLNNIQMNEELNWFMGLVGIYMMGGVYEAIDIFLGDWTCSSCPQIPILGRNEDSFSEELLRGPEDLDRPPWRVSRDVLVCRVDHQRNHASLKSRWVGWKYFNRPLRQQILNEPQGASATAHNRNTVESEIQCSETEK